MPDRDRDLLFGTFAVRGGHIAPRRLEGAWRAWRAEGSGTLADHLVDAGDLSPESRESIAATVERELEQHGDDATVLRSIAPAEAATGADEASMVATLAAAAAGDAGYVLMHTLGDASSGERYTLTRLHAKGGLGQVWVARDGSLDRDVAFKEIQPRWAGDRAVWRRFLREAKVTGQLEHPGIVPVYELAQRPGTDQPFYTMRFVKGRTLSEAIAAYHARLRDGSAGPLDLQALLTAFIGVANAIGYAHAKGVIHRDLKGDNVILGDFGEVIVLDWGLAKIVGQPDEAATEAMPAGDAGDANQTRAGQVLGTPAYMAPEQAAGQLDRIGPATDIYGLGAILYVILTGRAPFGGSNTDELLAKVVRDAPPRPRSVRPGAPAALEAICLKALAKEPAERYASAEALADDVRRFAADEPVSVYREPLVRRASRWARRHRTLVAGVMALVLTATVALSVGTVLLRQKQVEIEHQRAQADANFRLARKAVDEYLSRVADSPELKAKGLETLRRKLFGTARDFYAQFAAQRGDSAALRDDLGSATLKLADINRQMGDAKQGEQLFQQAIAIYGKLADEFPGEPAYRRSLAAAIGDLALLYGDTGRVKEAEAEYKRAASFEGAFTGADSQHPYLLQSLGNVYDNLGILYQQTGRVEECEASYRKGLAVRERLVKAHPDDEDYQSGLVNSNVNLAMLYALTGRSGQAEPFLAAASQVAEKLLAAHPDQPTHQHALGATLNNLGGIYTLTGRPAEARVTHQRALAIRERLSREHPTIPLFSQELAGSYVNLGELDAREGHAQSAVTWLDKGIDALGGVLAVAPKDVNARYFLAYAQSWRGRALDALGRTADADAAWVRAASFNDRGDPTIRSGQIASQARHGGGAAAADAAEAMLREKGVPPEVAYELAEALAWAGRHDRALAVLAGLSADGYFKTPGTLDAAKADPAFAALRGRAEFSRL